MIKTEDIISRVDSDVESAEVKVVESDDIAENDTAELTTADVPTDEVPIQTVAADSNLNEEPVEEASAVITEKATVSLQNEPLENADVQVKTQELIEKNTEDDAVTNLSSSETEMQPIQRVIENKSEETRDIPASICDWTDAVCTALIVCVLLFTFLFKSCAVDGTSMMPTYQDKQRVFAVVPYSVLKTGDVVIIDAHNNLGKPLFKRVVATEYQYVTMDQQTGAIYVDGEEFCDPIPATLDNKKGDIEFPFYVPSGCVFVMGDNRYVSNDSRYDAVGFIDMRSITGKVFY